MSEPQPNGTSLPTHGPERPPVAPAQTTSQTLEEKLQAECGFKAFNPTKFDKDTKFVYCQADRIPQLFAAVKERIGLYAAEDKQIERTYVDYITSDANVTPFATIDRRRFVLREQGNDDKQVEGSKSYELAAVITVYEGRGAPPEMDENDNLESDLDHWETRLEELKTEAAIDADELRHVALEQQKIKYELQTLEDVLIKPVHEGEWKRVYLPRSHPSGLRYRWTKVDLVKQDGAFENSNKLRDRRDFLASWTIDPNLQLYYVKLGVQTEPFTLMELLHHVRGQDAYQNRVRTYDIVRALLEKHFGGEDRQLVLHREGYFDLADQEKTTAMRGLLHNVGFAQTLRIGTSGQPVLNRGLIAKLFYQPTSIADFLQNYFGVHNQEDAEKLDAQITRALRGRKISFKHPTEAGMTEKVLNGNFLSIFNAETAVNRMKHSIWKNNIDLEYPQLPCINLGSEVKPLLLPAEMVTLLPMQCFTKPRTAELNAEIDVLHAQLGLESAHGKNLPLGQVASASSYAPRPTVKELNAQFAAAFPQPEIVFVEAGTENIISKAWKNFQEAICDDERLQGYQPKKASFLKYRPGQDPITEWLACLQLPLKASAPKSEDGTPVPNRKLVLVICIKKDQHNSRIYNILKLTCDVVLGVQTYFVNTKTLKQYADKPDGSKKAANEVLKRIRIRNPPFSEEKSQQADVAIGLHVSRIFPTEEGATKEMFCVAVASRDARLPEQYQSAFVLKSSEEMKTFDPSGMICDMVERVAATGEGQNPHRVVVVRTGILTNAVLEKAPGQPDSATRLPAYVDMSSPGLKSRSNAFKPDRDHDFQVTGGVAVDTTSATDQNLTADSVLTFAKNELKRFEQALPDRMGRKITVSYVLLGEDDADSYLRAHPGEEYLKKAQFYPTGEIPTSDYIQPIKVTPDAPTVALFRRLSKKTVKLVTLTILGAKLANAKTDRIKGQKAAEIEREQDTADQDVNAQATFGSRRVHDTELKKLTAMWSDRHLGLYMTHWPIVSHLASSIADRANLYLQTKPSDKIAEYAALDGDKEVPSHTLVQPKPAVAGSLYYL